MNSNNQKVRLINKSKALEIFSKLEKAYPNAQTELRFSSDFELLVAVILSAQCTDKRVNEVTDKLFKVYNSPYQFATLEQSELEKWIYSCGFYRTKSKNIISASRDLVAKHDGNVPSSFQELISLAGVGRKTANVILSVAFGKDAFAVDTHVFRLSNRLGLSSASTPERVEADVTTLLEGAPLGKLHHLLIFHGRYCCHSQKPSCETCPVQSDCAYFAAK